MLRSQDIKLFEFKMTQESSWQALTIMGLNKTLMFATNSVNPAGPAPKILQNLKHIDSINTNVTKIISLAKYFNVRSYIKSNDCTQTLRII
jgi:hypothetical protein